MMTLANAETRRVTELVGAFEEHEITMHEFSECLEGLSSEALQVIASFTSGSEDLFPPSDRLRSARQLCRTFATTRRAYC